MNGYIERHEATNMILRRLEQYPTLSPFCRMFYRFLYDLMGEPSVESEKLEQAFHLFLRCECRRHQAVGRVIHHGHVNLMEILRIGRTAHDVLERLRQALQHMELTHPPEVIIRELLSAECSYHLGRAQDVVESLQRAVSLGCHHPLVHFALGYNTYVSAMQRFTRAGDRKGEIVAHDPAAFQGACREAIRAFQGGLGDSTFDGQIHWWIGLIWEMLGERSSARLAFKSAMDADPENFSCQVEEKLQRLEKGGAVSRRPAERERLARLTPITDEDIAEAREFLEAWDSFPIPEEN